jgi:hypothetical protein
VRCNVRPHIQEWIADEPSMSDGNVRPQADASCDMRFVRLNAIFIRATTFCSTNYMDSTAGYYALERTKQCVGSMQKDTLTAKIKPFMLELDNDDADDRDRPSRPSPSSSLDRDLEGIRLP